MNIHINNIGFFAQQVLERSERALVSGIASRGVYLQPKNDWTLYLSLEKYCGPLTLNLKEGSAKLEKIIAGCSVKLSPEEIHFLDEEITISLEDCSIWHPPLVDSRLKFNHENIEEILSLVNKIIPDNPYLPLLSMDPGDIPGVPVIGERIRKLQDALKKQDSDKISDGAIKLLGLGPGLTPLGDDFLLGVILTLNRWGHLFSSDIVNNLNQIILENTQLKTTRISSSLLACAIEGAADERLIKVLDGVISGSAVTQNDMRNLLRWGNTSGITVLAGMISVIKTKDTVS